MNVKREPLTDHRPVLYPVLIEQVANVLRRFATQRGHCFGPKSLRLRFLWDVIFLLALVSVRIQFQLAERGAADRSAPATRPGSSFCWARGGGRSSAESNGGSEARRDLNPALVCLARRRKHSHLQSNATSLPFPFEILLFYGFFLFLPLFSGFTPSGRLIILILIILMLILMLLSDLLNFLLK